LIKYFLFINSCLLITAATKKKKYDNLTHDCRAK
jgi:hypothetical protein